MSVFVPLSKLQIAYANTIAKITSELEIISREDEEEKKPVYNPMTKKFAMPTYNYAKSSMIRCYSIFDLDGIKHVAVPYSYYYHHLNKAPKVPVNHSQTKLAFVGKLLERQADIKDQAIEILNRTGSILLCLHTGFGKTIFTLYLLSRIGMKTLVFCHRAIIMQQWMESIAKYLPQVKAKILQTKDKSFDDYQIVIANPTNITKLKREAYADFGCLIMDEVHTMCTEKNSQALFMLSPSYVIGLSATPQRSDGMDALLELYLGPECINKPMKRLFHVYTLQTGFVPNKEYGSNMQLMWGSVISSQAKDLERNKLLCKLVWFFSKRNILVLCKLVEHANILHKMLLELGEDVDVFMEGMKKVNYSCRVLIATFSKGGVGFDHPKLDMLIGAGDVEENFMQYLGRIFRRDDVQPIYIDVKDKMPTLEKHSASRLQICEDMGGQIHPFKTTFKRFPILTEHLFQK
jgi:superfamily II DNA or RNA helicase